MPTGTKRVRNMPNDATLPAWLLGEVIATLDAAGVLLHYGQGAQVTTPDASDIGTSKTLAQALAIAFAAHANDAVLHAAVDATMGTLAAAYSSTPALPANLTEVEAIANEIKGDINGHIPHATAHRAHANRSGGIASLVLVTTTDAIDQGTANALLNELKACFNRHVALGIGTLLVD